MNPDRDESHPLGTFNYKRLKTASPKQRRRNWELPRGFRVSASVNDKRTLDTYNHST